MRILGLFLLLCAALFGQQWETDIDCSLQLAKADTKPVLVYAFDAY
ncbi:MAG: hypothetical protein V3W41_21730 [Planctomycetota bacterium]